MYQWHQFEDSHLKSIHQWLMVLGLVLNSCVTIQHIPVDSNEFRSAYLPPATYAASLKQCFAATLTALKKEEYEVASTDETTGTIKTTKRKFIVNATVTGGSSTITVGTKMGSVANAPRNFTLEQAALFQFQIVGQGRSCTVSISKAKLWNGIEALDTLQPQGGEWTRRNLRDPIYESIEEELKKAR